MERWSPFARDLEDAAAAIKEFDLRLRRKHVLAGSFLVAEDVAVVLLLSPPAEALPQPLRLELLSRQVQVSVDLLY
jgi:hypothetical protein